MEDLQILTKSEPFSAVLDFVFSLHVLFLTPIPPSASPACHEG